MTQNEVKGLKNGDKVTVTWRGQKYTGEYVRPFGSKMPTQHLVNVKMGDDEEARWHRVSFTAISKAVEVKTVKVKAAKKATPKKVAVKKAPARKPRAGDCVADEVRAIITEALIGCDEPEKAMKLLKALKIFERKYA